MIELNEELTKKIADLARLELTDLEIKSMTHELQDIFKYFEQLQKVDTKNIEPMTHPLDIETPLREDHVVSPFVDVNGRPKVLSQYKNTPEILSDGFKVPPII